MSFIANNFGPVGGFHGSDKESNASGFALYSYITPDDLATVKTAGYFNELRDQVFQGDVIYVGSNQLHDPENPTPKDSINNEYTMIYFDSVPESPSTGNVTLDSKDIQAVLL